VNCLLYGQRDEPYAVITGLSQRLEGTLAPNAILPTIVETVAQALKLPYVAILLKREDKSELVASYGKPICLANPIDHPLPADKKYATLPLGSPEPASPEQCIIREPAR
jgi:hypothetical protein